MVTQHVRANASRSLSFFSGPTPDWLDDVTSPDALRACGVFDPALVTGLLAKCRRTGGTRMGNTDNMRLLAVLSTQLAYRQFVVGDHGGLRRDALPEPSVAVDMVNEDRSTR